MIRAHAEQVKRELLDLFDRHDLDVAVGLTRPDRDDRLTGYGICVRSQTDYVDAANIGIPKVMLP